STSADIMSLFVDLHRQGQTIIMVTHEHDIAEFAQRIITLVDGMVASSDATLTSAPFASAAPPVVSEG
ncbi:MAG: macrolide ABC transporter ATP-binding protein, partial [Gemmatimonadota bacterium]